MKIVHIVIGKVNTNKMNGVNKVVHAVAATQVALGHEVTIWGITKNPVHTYPARNYHTQLFLDEGKFRMSSAIKKHVSKMPAHTVFHFHGGFIPQFYFVAKALVANGFSYFLTPHGSYNTVAIQRSYWKKRIFIRLFESYLVRHARAVQFIGQSEIDGAMRLFDVPAYRLIPNGENVQSSCANLPLNERSEVVFGFCGRLDIHTKGLDILLDGFARVRRSYTNVKLLLIGDGEERKKLEKQVEKLGLTAAVVFCGSVFGSEKNTLFKSLNFFILNSRNEGMPGVVLEAAAMGIPVLVSEATNLAAYVRQYRAGVAFEKNTSEAIAMGISQAVNLVNTSEYNAWSANAIRMVKEAFSWEKIVKQLMDMYAC